MLSLCIQIFYRNQTYVANLTKSLIYNLLNITVFESCFLFGGKFYKQCDDVAIGSPLRPTLGNLFMCYFENIWLENCLPHFKPVIKGSR